MSKHKHRRYSSYLQQSKYNDCIRLAVEDLEGRRLLSIAAPAYPIPTAPGVEIQPLISTGDSVPLAGGPAGSTYRMAGIPDGLGAFDNGDGTFTVLMNHELRNTQGINRANSILIGGAGADQLTGGANEDILLGESTSLDDATLFSALSTWAGPGNFAARVNSLKSVFSADKIIDDGALDTLDGGGAQNWLLG